jgi:hypothetical protein
MSMLSAANDCYEAGQEFWKDYEANHPDEAKEILDRERLEKQDPNSCVDPNADSDRAWNHTYSAGAQYLGGYSKILGFASQGGFAKSNNLKENGYFEFAIQPDGEAHGEAKLALIALLDNWAAWYAEVLGLKFSTSEEAALYCDMVNKANRLKAIRKSL